MIYDDELHHIVERGNDYVVLSCQLEEDGPPSLEKVRLLQKRCNENR
jgi:hypothetical protein